MTLNLNVLKGIMIWFALLTCALLDVTSARLLSRPRRAWIIDSFDLEEGHRGPFPYELGTIISDKTYKVFFEIAGEGVEKYPQGVLSIDRMSGVLLVHKSVDYEETHELRLKLIATREDKTVDTRLGIDVRILDINDNPPRFEKDLYEVTVGEDVAQGTTLLTVSASDRDEPQSPNSTFHHEIGSVSPKPPNAEFFVDESGELSFKGCLDYEVGDSYTVLLLAKDHGEVVSLSSTTTALIHIQDSNNHLPVISGQTGPSAVREGETGAVPLRVHVTDRDLEGTPAWRAQYTVEGDPGGHFQMETDPLTNDGILTVVQPLDFEEGAERELLISVENEVKFSSCRVQARPASGLWGLDSGPVGGAKPPSLRVTIQVEDANDAPMFTLTVGEAGMEENVAPGAYVETVIAVDHDLSHPSDFVYKMGNDPGDWLKVDPQTGVITTTKRLDRESPHVVDNIYTAVLHAVDSGTPPMTGSATLLIHVYDQNDNVPKLSENHAEMCIGNTPGTTNLTALDPDNDPFGGPFTFQLLGDVKGKWSLDRSYGYEVNLVKEPIVHSGIHTVKLQISDKQGVHDVNELTVTVCDCTSTPSCRGRRNVAASGDSGLMGILFFALLVLLITLMLAFFLTCKKDFSFLSSDLTYEVQLLQSNIETPGTDCKMPIKPVNTPPISTYGQYQETSVYNWNSVQQTYSFKKDVQERFDYQESWDIHQDHNHRTQMSQHQASDGHPGFMSEGLLWELLHQRLDYVEATEDALGDYPPQPYAREQEDADSRGQLEEINIVEEVFDYGQLDDLGPRFKELAAVCEPKAPPGRHFATAAAASEPAQ